MAGEVDAADDEAWGGRGPSASYAEWLAEGQQDQAGEPEPDPAEFDPGPEVDDQGGMSEYRYHEPEPWQ